MFADETIQSAKMDCYFDVCMWHYCDLNDIFY